MNAFFTNNNFVLMDETNLTEQHRRQAELMYLKSYVTWLTMKEKTVLVDAKKPA